jgi:hypothetical protein
MKLSETDIRPFPSTCMGVCRPWILLVLLVLLSNASQPTGWAQQRVSDSVRSSPLTTQQVVERLVGMNLRRAQALQSYRGTRTYRVDYRGFPGTRNAEMVVDVNYRAPATKEFTIRSSSGSRVIIDKVFRKLLQAEQDALSVDAQRRTALNADNYDFTMVAYESTPGHPMYVLAVAPRTADKFLYRGRVWVDAKDFAVVRLEAEPAKNPSFWTKSNEIEQLYVKVNGFWLPKRNHSVSSIRLGGRADLTIQYEDYVITASAPVGDLSALTPGCLPDTCSAQLASEHPE